MQHEDGHLPGPFLPLERGRPLLWLPTHPEGLPRTPAIGRPMTRCECEEVGFDQVAERVEAGEPLQQVAERTGCGRNCSACVDDLLRHLHARRGRPCH